MASETKRAKVIKPPPMIQKHDLQNSAPPERAAVTRRDQNDAAPPELIMAARLSKRLGISTVTLWRWRHDEELGFPKGRKINDRVYFPWHEVAAWLERQQQIA
jgi:predicted DNA-binding transcriptional regulator AlpA